MKPVWKLLATPAIRRGAIMLGVLVGLAAVIARLDLPPNPARINVAILSGSQSGHYHALVARLAARAQVVKPRLFVIERGPPLGLAVGRGVWSSTVAFTNGLLALPPAEGEGVFAHELAHVRHRDLVIHTPAVLFSAALLWFQRLRVRRLQLNGVRRLVDQHRLI